ncbi:MAG TPA: nucleotidyltransferase [Bacteroidales bacterium]|nr:nucleotidyltransferase [Bacteroidales bacterium]
MKAMIFAAGKGTRLKPLTDHTPKALVKINDVPMIEIVIKKLIAIGVSEIIINVHYLADQIIEFLKSKNNFDIRIEISDETSELLDTGGGLKKASWFFNDDEPFILHNADVISNIDLLDMLNFHKEHNAVVTLAMRERKSSRYFIFNEKMNLCGWENTKTSVKIISKDTHHPKLLAFSGIHMISPAFFNSLNNEGCFSIIQSYIESSKNAIIKAYKPENKYWFDIGNIDKLKEAEQFLAR